MALTAKALREKRASLAAEIRRQADTINALEAEGKPTAEAQAAWEKVNGEYNALTAQIDRAERVERVEADQQARVGDPDVGRGPVTPPGDGAAAEVTEETRCLALAAWARKQAGLMLTRPERAACRALRFNPSVRNIRLGLYATRDYARLQRTFRGYHHSLAADRLTDFRANLTMGSGPAGGYLQAPETMRRSLEVNMLAYGGVAQVAEIITTATGEEMSWPTADDTSNEGAQLGEGAPIGSSVDPSFGKVLWSAYKFSSKPVLYPAELDQDSVFNLAATLGEMLGERLGRAINRKFTTGTGAATPKGVVTCATAGVTAASATAIAADEIIRLEHAIDPAYRAGAGYMMHDSILLALRLLKDGQGRYLWQTGYNTGTPDTLNNRPITINQHMQSSIATGTKTILFGQFSRYKIRRVGQVRMYHLTERYRDNDLDAVIAFLRCDGNLLTAGTSPLVYLIQA